MNAITGRLTLILRGLFELILLAALAPNLAAGQSGLVLRAEKNNLQAGEIVTVQVLIENAPLIYGAEVHLSFDPLLLEVVDANPDQPGIQLISGDFLKLDQATFLQNQANNQTGKLDYTLALLNPAPPVQGSGWLFSIKFRAKAPGTPKITINENSLFGTQTGQTIAPVRQDLELKIGVAQEGTPRPENTQVAPLSTQPTRAAGSTLAPTAPVSATEPLSPASNAPEWGTLGLLGVGAVTLIAGGLWWAFQRKI